MSTTITYPITLVSLAGKTEVFSNDSELLEYLKFQNPTAIVSLNVQLKNYGIHVVGSGNGALLKKIEEPMTMQEHGEVRISIKI